MSGWNGLGVKSWLAIVLALGLSLSACGGDDDDANSTGGDGDGDTSVGDGDNNSSGDGDMNSTGTTDSGTGDMQVMSVPCGSNTCMGIDIGGLTGGLGGGAAGGLGGLGGMLGGLLPAPCCADEATSTCGTSNMGGACMPPPESDERCPELVTPIMNGASCCTDTGTCGLVDTLTGSGACTPLADVAMQLGFLSMFGISVPDPINCDGSAVDTGEDGGVTGDGDGDSDAGL